ncbi:asparaginase-domain-containing protein [Daldinia decipiens]|uniref:asparaginase-domain-containing protein n=1 Tax=Daldinia decipiens TaxID=326647 RepID=UPI0020C2D711|nr:asparaginase-domain-containing protein [Daldinia decipiens]KAI1659935.1 asparaginase-domain-containing protein [Daldinia decipiens]
MGGITVVASGNGEVTTYPESRVLIIITGGTICMQPSASGLVPVDGFLDNAMAPRLSFNDMSERVPLPAVKDGVKVTIDSLRTPPSSYSRHIRYGALEFSPLLDSSSISSIGWTQIATTIKANYHLFDGFVVLHGTDSLSYTASALSFMMEDLGKPAILTGSQAPIFALQSDAVDNLLGSLIIAGTFTIPEVCLFFHHTLFRGNRTTKVSASSFDAFASPNCAPLAKVTSLGVDVNWSLVRRPTKIAQFRVTSYVDTAHVACVRIFPGIKPEMVDSVLRVPHLRGLILETFGMGNAPEGVDGSLTKVISEAVQRGIIIVNVSQCANGFVSPLYAPGFALGRAGVVFGHDLTSEAALTKLSYLLALLPGPDGEGDNAAEITARMSRSIRGELTELAATTSFAHPSGDLDTSWAERLTGAEAAFAALGYTIATGNLQATIEILEAADRDEGEGPMVLLRHADYMGNTAVHLAALGPEPAILEELLVRGASVHPRNRANNTPMFLAQRAKSEECIRLLREAGGMLWEEEKGVDGVEKGGVVA